MDPFPQLHELEHALVRLVIALQLMQLGGRSSSKRRLFLLITASFYKPYSPATSFQTGLVPPLAYSLRAAM